MQFSARFLCGYVLYSSFVVGVCVIVLIIEVDLVVSFLTHVCSCRRSHSDFDYIKEPNEPIYTTHAYLLPQFPISYPLTVKLKPFGCIRKTSSSS